MLLRYLHSFSPTSRPIRITYAPPLYPFIILYFVCMCLCAVHICPAIHCHRDIPSMVLLPTASVNRYLLMRYTGYTRTYTQGQDYTMLYCTCLKPFSPSISLHFRLILLEMRTRYDLPGLPSFNEIRNK